MDWVVWEHLQNTKIVFGAYQNWGQVKIGGYWISMWGVKCWRMREMMLFGKLEKKRGIGDLENKIMVGVINKTEGK